MNFIQYVGGKNPMPGLGPSWLCHPELTRFNYVLLRSPSPALLAHERLNFAARDGQWALFRAALTRRGRGARANAGERGRTLTGNRRPACASGRGSCAPRRARAARFAGRAAAARQSLSA